MVRIVLALILTFNLLICPLRCAGCFALESDTATPAQVGCSCCASIQEPWVPAPDQFPADQDCGCRDCLCQGAVMPNVDDFGRGVSEVVACVCWDPSILFLGSKVAILSHQPPNTPLTLLAGRDVCIAHQSLLN